MNLQYLFLLLSSPLLSSPLISCPSPPLHLLLLFLNLLTAEPSHNILKIAAAISCELELGVNGRKGGGEEERRERNGADQT